MLCVRTNHKSLHDRMEDSFGTSRGLHRLSPRLCGYGQERPGSRRDPSAATGGY